VTYFFDLPVPPCQEPDPWSCLEWPFVPSPSCRLLDARHSCASIMHAQAVPIAVISAWLGHADPAFTMRTYVHAQNDALNAAAATWQKVVTPT
jgi:integrase